MTPISTSTTDVVLGIILITLYQPVSVEEEPIEMTIQCKRWHWISHTLHQPDKFITRQALCWTPKGKRRSGRSKHSWRRGLEKNMECVQTTRGQIRKSKKSNKMVRLYRCPMLKIGRRGLTKCNQPNSNRFGSSKLFFVP